MNGEPYPYGAQGKAAVIEANELEAWGDEAVNSANTRIPYHSTMLQTTGAGDIVGETGPYGAQGKAAIIEANELEAWGDEAVNSANTRIPYHSTMVQLQDPRGAEGKAAIVEANELEAWGDEAVDSANGRIPYHSTLTQLDDPRGAEGKAAIVEANELEAWGDEAVDSANGRIPYHSTLLQTRGAGDIIGEKGPYGAQGKAAIIEANELEAWGDEAVDSANGRIPYHSTLLQTRGAGDIVGEKGVYGAQGKAAIVEANELEAWGDEAVDSATEESHITPLFFKPRMSKVLRVRVPSSKLTSLRPGEMKLLIQPTKESHITPLFFKPEVLETSLVKKVYMALKVKLLSLKLTSLRPGVTKLSTLPTVEFHTIPPFFNKKLKRQKLMVLRVRLPSSRLTSSKDGEMRLSTLPTREFHITQPFL